MPKTEGRGRRTEVAYDTHELFAGSNSSPLPPKYRVWTLGCVNSPHGPSREIDPLKVLLCAYRANRKKLGNPQHRSHQDSRFSGSAFLTALLSGEQGRGREGASKGGGVVSRTLPYLVIRIVAFIANIITERERDLKENKKE